MPIGVSVEGYKWNAVIMYIDGLLELELFPLGLWIKLETSQGVDWTFCEQSIGNGAQHSKPFPMLIYLENEAFLEYGHGNKKNVFLTLL